MLSQGWLIGALATAGVVAATVIILLLRRKVPAEERERRRRLQVNAAGRICDATVIEVRSLPDPSGRTCCLLHYTYTLHGVEYSATQDVAALLEHIGCDPGQIAGPASIKYLPANPSNSIVVCEQWSGLRENRKARATLSH